MTDLAVLDDLIERLEKAGGPDRELDIALTKQFIAGKQYRHPDLAPPYTTSLDAAVALVERVLPGWGWQVGTCYVSDDALVFPDFNGPHGDRLRAEFGEVEVGSALDTGIDIDRRPPGNPALALCIALLRALRETGGKA